MSESGTKATGAASGASAAGGELRRRGWYFSPSRFSAMARPSYRIELLTVVFFSITLGVVDNTFVSVFLKQTYAAVAPPILLNFVVALAGSASEIANILSFVWVSLSNGARKVPFINALQLAVIVLVASLALVPETVPGLLVLTGLVLMARVSWSGIILLRPTVWRVNYRQERAAIVGRFSSAQQFIVAVVGLGLGAVLDRSPEVFRFATPLAAAMGLVALNATRKLRVRREKALIRGELDPTERTRVGRPWQGPAIVWRVLKKDPRFAQFMACMFILGYGNIMLVPIVVIVLKDQFHLGYLGSIALASTIPYVLMPLAVPMWARLLDRAHVVKFRSVHSWAFVAAGAAFMLGVAFHSPAFLVVGSVMLAIAFGGGSIAWNLGHVDFSPPAETSQYMATHVTLNGVRGLLAPLSAVALYERLRAWDMTVQESASIVLGVSVVLAALGAVGFMWLGRSMKVGKRR